MLFSTPTTVEHNILTTVSQALDQAGFAKEAHLGVALSGGADSVALLMALQRCGYNVEALHCNFELRGRESDADEAACRRLCRNEGIALTVKHFRTRAYATRQAISIEMAARQLRYAWFAEMAEAHALDAVCVAHHRDDNVETMLLNLIRGTGIHGLTGMDMLTRRDDGLCIVRPLLDVARADIELWLREQGLTWQTDSTNLQPDTAMRNAIRLRLLPLMETMNPAVRQTLADTMRRLGDAATLYDEAAARAKAEVTTTQGAYTAIDIQALLRQAAPATVLFELLKPYGFNADIVADIMAHIHGQPGHVWQGSRGARLLRDRGRLLIDDATSGSAPTATDMPTAPTVLPLEGRLSVGGVTIAVSRQVVDVEFAIPRQGDVACFDMSGLQLPLTVRRVQEGDRFRPFGMEGTRLVSDLLTDAKVSLFERERQMVVLSADEIIWVVGRRAAAGHEVTAATRHAMVLRRVQ